MSRRTVGWLLVLGLLLSLSPVPGIRAQGDGEEVCSALVEAALQTVEESCVGLGNNEACYGYNRVDAEFWQPRDDLVFSAPADRAPLLDLRRVSTAPLDMDSAQWEIRR